MLFRYATWNSLADTPSDPTLATSEAVTPEPISVNVGIYAHTKITMMTSSNHFSFECCLLIKSSMQGPPGNQKINPRCYQKSVGRFLCLLPYHRQWHQYLPHLCRIMNRICLTNVTGSLTAAHEFPTSF